MENQISPNGSGTQGQGQKNDNSIDIMVIIAISVWFISALGLFILQKLVPNWFESPIRYVHLAANLLIAFMPTVLGLTVKNKDLKIVGIILGVSITIFLLYTNLNWFLQIRF